MGGGVSTEKNGGFGRTHSGISFVPSQDATDMQSKLKRLLNNKKQMDKVFKSIASIDKGRGKLGKSYDINYGELIQFFMKRDESHALKSLTVEKEVIKVAFTYVAGDPLKNVINKKQFRVFLPTLFLFTELWKVFEIVDDNVDDKKIFLGEFERAYKSFQDASGQVQPIKTDAAISGVKVDKSIISEEEWRNAFTILDKDKNGHISFLEFCSYAADNIISPMDFIDQERTEGDGDPENGESAPSDSTTTADETSAEDDAVVVTAMGYFTKNWDEDVRPDLITDPGSTEALALDAMVEEVALLAEGGSVVEAAVADPTPAAAQTSAGDVTI